jgi:hypothetical protein
VVNALSSLRSDADFDNHTSQITWRAINSALWDAEANLPPQDQDLHNIVSGFDGQGVTLKTHDKDSEVTKGKPKTSNIQSMAKRAAAKELG